MRTLCVAPTTSMPFVPMVLPRGSVAVYGVSTGMPIVRTQPSTSISQYSGWRMYVTGDSATSMLENGLNPLTTRRRSHGDVSNVRTNARVKSIGLHNEGSGTPA